jgi:hypothetical protein
MRVTLLVIVVATVISSTPATAAPCDQPGYVFKRHLWPANALFMQPFGTQFLQGTGTKPLLLDINAIKAACDADERCTIFTTNGRLLAIIPVETMTNRTLANFRWRKYYCGPCNDRNADEIVSADVQPWQGSGCCGSSLQDVRIPKSAAYFTRNQIDSNGQRCCGSYIAQEAATMLPDMLVAKDVVVETPYQATSRIGIDMLTATTETGSPCAQIHTYAATPSLCGWLRNLSAAQPASGCCPACVAMLCARTEAAQRQQGPALQKIVAAFPKSNAKLRPCCKPFFTAHSNEAEYYCAISCGMLTSMLEGKARYWLRTQPLAAGEDQLNGRPFMLEAATLAAARATACPGTCNAITRGKLEPWSSICGSAIPGIDKVKRKYIVVKSKGVQGGGRPVRKLDCAVNAAIC